MGVVLYFNTTFQTSLRSSRLGPLLLTCPCNAAGTLHANSPGKALEPRSGDTRICREKNFLKRRGRGVGAREGRELPDPGAPWRPIALDARPTPCVGHPHRVPPSLSILDALPTLHACGVPHLPATAFTRGPLSLRLGHEARVRPGSRCVSRSPGSGT